MKKFEAPVISVEELFIADVIATSGCPQFEGCDNDTGCPVDF